jgi:uncharacterized zinc-type alcohol dehydrogenase-like protein
MSIHAYAALDPDGEFKPFEYELGDLGKDEVEIDVEYCGICHSDLSMLKNDWQMTQYPFVPGHEIVGKVSKVGENVKSLKIGRSVGLGWFSQSCMDCQECMSGDHNLCAAAEGVIIGRHGGFADKVRAHAGWVVPLPQGINASKAGPLFCGGITVFNPIVQNRVQPTDRVGVVGIGGLGHMALGFLNAWGCEVTAFSTSPDKEKEAKELGAHHFVNSRSENELNKLSGSFDFILVTVNVDLNWNAYIQSLRPKGRLHLVGAASTVSAAVFPLLVGQKSIGASPLGSPATTSTMLQFAARHQIEPITELVPMSQVNEAMEKLKNGKPRYRLVLEAGK